jgi:transcriptional regulator with XRE-family HTH domain
MVYLGSGAMAGPRKARPAVALSPEQVAIEARLRQVLSPLIQREREARGMTQENLAERAGIHWTTVGKIERGRQIPSIALLSVLAKALDLTVTDLLRAALPEIAVPTGPEEDPTLAFIKALPKPERRKLLPLLQALQKWKEGR